MDPIVPASEETSRVDQAANQELAAARGKEGAEQHPGPDDLHEPESLASVDVILVTEPTTSRQRPLPPPNPGATYRGAETPLPKPPRRPALATVESEGHGFDEETPPATAAASLPPPTDYAAHPKGEPRRSDRGNSLLPVVASTPRASDRSADERSASARPRLWPPNRRLAAAAVIAAGAMAVVVWVAGRAVEGPTQHAVHLGSTPAKQHAPARVEANATPKPPADQPAESKSLPTPAGSLPAHDVEGAPDEGTGPVEGDLGAENMREQSPAEPANEQGHPVAAQSPAGVDSSNEEGHGDAAEPRSPDDERTADTLKPFDGAAARTALNAAAIAASGCSEDDSASPSPAIVSVTFVPSGRAKTAVVSGGSHAGTARGSCIAGAFRGLSVPAFSGGPMTAQITVTLR